MAYLVQHDDSFQPDHILRVSARDYAQACNTRYSVLVNGTSPGPELRLKEGQVNWIRVYNDLKDENTTIVSRDMGHSNGHRTHLADNDSTGMALLPLQLPFQTAPRGLASGLFQQVTFSITKSNLKSALQEPTSTIRMLAFRPTLRTARSSWIQPIPHHIPTTKNVLLR